MTQLAAMAQEAQDHAIENLSVKEVAKRYGICEMTVYRALKSGKLKGRKFGGNYRTSQKAIDDWSKIA